MNKINDYEFHTQSIWSILPDFKDESTFWTGGRDGKICEVDLQCNKTRVLLKGDKPIICIAND